MPRRARRMTPTPAPTAIPMMSPVLRPPLLLFSMVSVNVGGRESLLMAAPGWVGSRRMDTPAAGQTLPARGEESMMSLAEKLVASAAMSMGVGLRLPELQEGVA